MRHVRLRSFRLLALATALTGLYAGSASAQYDRDWQRECIGSTYAINPDTPCNRAYTEGLAAVRVGKASDPAGTWGYIDKQGRMAILPTFQEAEPFQNGLAAVQQDKLWGYIDTRGEWVVKPRFTRATGFNAEGTALVEADERDVLINRQGQVVKTFELGTRSWGFEPGQKLASMEVPQAPRLFDTATGRALTLPGDVMMLAKPDGGYLPAQRRNARYGGWWGLLDAEGRWAIAPDVLRSHEPPQRDGDTLAVRRDEEWSFVRPDGTPLSDARYSNVQRVTAGLWLVKPKGDGPPLLLDAKLAPVHTFSVTYPGVEERDGWKMLTDVDMLILVFPDGKMQKIPARFARVGINDGLAWVYAHPPAPAPDGLSDAARPAQDTDAAATITSPVPVVASPQDPPPPVRPDAPSVPSPPARPDAPPTAAANDATAAATAVTSSSAEASADDDAAIDAASDIAAPANAAVAVDVTESSTQTEATLVQIYRPDGTALLDADTAARLGQYRVTEFSPRTAADTAQDGPEASSQDAATLPLALLRPVDYEQPTGILTPSGKIVTNPDWDDMNTYNATAPLVVQTRKRTVGAIDAEGNWILAPTYAGIAGFNGAYSWARTPGMDRNSASLIDTRGQIQPLPARVEVNGEKIDGDLLYYFSLDDNRNRRWGLWNIRSASVAVKPTLENIEEFTDDWAKAQDNDRWGVIDRHGKWVLPATYSGSYELEYLGNGYLLAREPKRREDSSSYRESYRLINLRTGQRSPLLGEKPQNLRQGRFLAQGQDGATLLFDSQGRTTRLWEGAPDRKEQYGDWIYVQYRSRNGAIDARGNMKIAAVNGEFNPFFVQPEGLARVYDGRNYRLMDENGKTLLEKRGDGTPLASMKRIVFRDSNNSAGIITDLQGREITRVKGEYSLEEDKASEGVVPYRGDGDRYGFLNADGKRIVGPYFDRLGPLRNGLAVAQRAQRTGKLFGYIDLTGRYAIAPEFGWAADFQDGRALVRRDRLLEFIDTRGKTTALFGQLCGEIVVLDAQERQTWPREKLTCPEAAEIEQAPVPESAKAE
ncbi:WG repeat-containing protein [Achromobacter sp. UMC71]|uniref:WG repeat-containing protein n=1 Tax=Achromobacter sp. UMC71 TaxID=1862320 RepID=UPI0016042D3C|nr:WG repeat-containing protein [Achromobacter sp. UMC71]MBB1624276.1 hypothetical protein [Achromobacter sp. UMC71]